MHKSYQFWPKIYLILYQSLDNSNSAIENISCFVINNFSPIFFSDDCLYIFYICTDKVDEWPKNKGICSRLFQECEAKVQSEQDAVASGIAVDLPTSSTSAVIYLINIWQMFSLGTSDLVVKPYIPQKSLLQRICCKCLAW